MTSMTITNARLQRDDEGNYWLHVRSQSGRAASLNLSLTSKSDVARRAFEEWAKEQLDQVAKIVPTHDPN